VPILNPDDEADVQRYVDGQDFPYRVITQTREAAIGGIMLESRREQRTHGGAARDPRDVTACTARSRTR